VVYRTKRQPHRAARPEVGRDQAAHAAHAEIASLRHGIRLEGRLVRSCSSESTASPESIRRRCNPRVQLPIPERARAHRGSTSDDIVWYTDYAARLSGTLDPASGKVIEWQSPSGPKSEPYGISAISDILWYSESGPPEHGGALRSQGREIPELDHSGRRQHRAHTSVTTDGKTSCLRTSLVNTVTLVISRVDALPQ